MRVTIGIVAVFGLGASLAGARGQAPVDRRATLLPPQTFDPVETPRVARGAADESLPFPASTPVKRSGGPAWLSGTDPGVRPAGGSVSADPRQVRPLTPPPGTPRDEPSVVVKGLEKFRSAFGPGDAPPAGPQPGAANAAFRGTSPSGQPVYAGPPAYRWYGWGSVTPGANPYAPTGHYPRASANWYSITGATPGAFPVPVTEGGHAAAGTEPPVYVAPPNPRTPPATAHIPPPVVHRQPVSAAPQPLPAFPASLPSAPPVVEPPRFPTTGAESNVPPPVPVPTLPVVPVVTPVTVPTLTPPPVAVAPPSAGAPPFAVAPAEPIHLGVPAVPPALPVPTTDQEPVVGPRAVAGALTIAPVLPRTGEPTPLAPTPPVPAPPAPPTTAELAAPAGLIPGVQPAPVKERTENTPAPLPPSVREEKPQPQWKPTTAPATRDDWAPSGTAPRPQPRSADTWHQPGAADTSRPAVIARGQAPDDQPADPVVALIRRVCEGRATGVDVRWTGSKKLTVCFECRTAAEAQKLVAEISARPELAPYQIDFCVLVK